jgi:cytoskeletal protein RodZ
MVGPKLDSIVMDFGSDLRAAREQRKLTVDVLAARTKIPRQLLVDLEANDLSRWPRHQVYRHGFLRAYAAAVGLDAEIVIAKFQKAFPDEHPFEPAEAASSAKSPRASSRWLTAAVAFLAIGLSVLAVLFVDAPTSRDDRSGIQAVTPRRSTPSTGGKTEVPGSSKPASPASTAPLSTVPAPATASSEVAPDPPEVVQDSVVEGELVIESEPPGATAVVNGIGRGRTPTRVQYLPLESHTIRLVLAGYESQEQTVTLTTTRPSRTVTVVLSEIRER